MIRYITILGLIFVLFNSATADERHRKLQASGYEYISPLPNSQHVSRMSSIILRFKKILPQKLVNLDHFINVTGSKTAKCKGVTKIASDQRTIIFSPLSPFASGENVTVNFKPIFSGNISMPVFQYTFQVSDSEFGYPVVFPDELERKQEDKKNHLAKSASGEARILSNGVSVPANFPDIDITINNDPDDGLIFINYRDYPAYQLILNNSGEPVWYWHVPDDRRDFKAQSNGQLSMMIRDGYGGNGDGYIVLNQHYKYVKTIRASNGYWLDEHELLILPDSGYFIIGRREEVRDMSAYGKSANATVRETCIQEYTSNDELIFQWAAWDYFDPADLDYKVNGKDNYIRFPHMNAVFIDDDGHILLSSRHLSEVTKIHRHTGEIIWRLSGKKNQFTFVNDDLNGFHNQHAIRAVGNNRYTIFDNGNSHNPPQSRAVEYEIDTTNNTATLVWEFRNDKPQYYSYYMGNAQRLPNGNTLINWAVGELPKLSEITPDGQKAYEMTFADKTHVYRTFKMDWQGMSKTPYLIAESYPTHVDLVFNKFGDPDVAYYKIFGGKTANPQTVLDTAHVTLKRFTNLETGFYYFRVTAVDINGNESGYSNEEKLNVNLISPGANMARNGDFQNDKADWIWSVSGSANANWSVVNGESHISISNGGNQIYNVQLRQNGIPIIKGKDYIFEFDARADMARAVEIKVAQDNSPWINYSKIGYTALSTQQKHYKYHFTMEDATDFNARVVVNCGIYDSDVYIDNINIREDFDTAVNSTTTNPRDFRLVNNYPNPFNNQTTICYSIPQASRVNLNIYNAEGRRIAKYNLGNKSAGEHRFSVHSENWTSGIYIYVLEIYSNKTMRYQKANKMVLIK